MQPPSLSWLTFAPLIGMALVLATPSRSTKAIRIIALAATILPLALATWICISALRADAGAYPLIERIDWIRTLRAEYHVGIDRLSMSLVWLASLFLFLAVQASCFATGAGKARCALLLASEAGILGAFVSLDGFLLVCFSAAALLPLQLLIVVRNGGGRAASIDRCFLVAWGGSMLVLIAFVALRLESGTFSIPTLVELARTGKLTGEHLEHSGSLFGMPFVTWSFAFLCIGSAIQCSMAASILAVGIGEQRALRKLAPGPITLVGLAFLAVPVAALARLFEQWRAFP